MSITIEGKKAGKIWYNGMKLAQIWTNGVKIFDSKAAPVAEPEMVLVVNLTEDLSVGLSNYITAAPGDWTTGIEVVWGDTSDNDTQLYAVYEGGSGETQPYIWHTYNSPGQYRIKIKGQFAWGYNAEQDYYMLANVVTAIELLSGVSPLKYIYAGSFFWFEKLTSIPAGLFDYCTEVTRFDSIFEHCTSLASIPAGLFDKCTKANSFSRCFAETAITSIPDKLFAYDDIPDYITSFSYCFSGCSKLTAVPENLFAIRSGKYIDDVSYCFAGCHGITEKIPEFWNANEITPTINVTTGCFNNCDLAPNYEDAYNNGWADTPKPAPSGVMVLNYNAYRLTYESKGEVDLTYILGNDPEGKYTKNATLDWGDGSPIVSIVGNEWTTDKEKLKHTYPLETNDRSLNYSITIKGKIKWTGSAVESQIPIGTRYVSSIELPTNISPIYGISTYAFAYNEPLMTVPAELLHNCTDVTDLTGLFWHSYISDIPEELFSKCTNVIKLENIFEGNTFLQQVPENLFFYNSKVDSFIGCFSGCTRLDTIPENLFANCRGVYEFTQCFENCTSIRRIPAGLFRNNRQVTQFNMCFQGCTYMQESLPTLWLTYPGANGQACFNNCDGAPNYKDAYNAGWADNPVPQQDETEGMVLVVNIPSNNYSLDLSPWLSAAPGDGTTDISIDWGDVATASVNRARVIVNNFEVYTVEEREDKPVIEKADRLIEEEENQIATLAATDYPVGETQSGTGTITHTYATAGEYRITLKGEFKWGLGNQIYDLALQRTLTSIELHSEKSPIKYVATYAFYGCDSLRSIPGGLFNSCTKVTSFAACFLDCRKLQEIPSGLFDKCTEVTDFNTCFFDCYSLRAIPSGLFEYCTKVNNFGQCFGRCSTLQSIPAGLFINCLNVLYFDNCFWYCTGLTEIPNKLFVGCPNVDSFMSCFSNCERLVTIPAELFDSCTRVSDFSSCFAYCTRVTSNLPTLWLSHSNASRAGCFRDCTNAPNYAEAQAAGWA